MFPLCVYSHIWWFGINITAASMILFKNLVFILRFNTLGIILKWRFISSLEILIDIAAIKDNPGLG